ncbi:MAG: hypothetical protein OXF79_08615 [Chloroflexi bacterium]|nr:hypothetical protein [Chloroflexota bacterium]
MPKLSSSEDLYRQLVEDGNDSWLLGLLAFAIAEEQRMDWMKHSKNQHGVFPDTEAIKDWYQQQPSSFITRAKGDAENVLRQYADEVLEEVLANERREILESTIVREIREVGKFWPQFGSNVAGGLASAFLFAALLAITAFIVLMDSSPLQLGLGTTQ